MDHVKTIEDGLVPLYGVKSPYTAVESGYGFQGVLLYDKAMDEVQCHICGGMYVRLAPHVLAEHKMRSTEYKKEFGFSKSTALMGEDERKAHIESMVERIKNGEVTTIDKQVHQKHNPRSKGRTWKNQMEFKNNRDMCPEQMIKRVKVLAAMLGRTPTARDFGHQASVKSSFNVYSELLKQAELTPAAKHKFPTKWSQDLLIQSLLDFRKKYDRDPMVSDTERGLLPTLGNFRYHFNTWGEAKLAAGFELVKNQYG